MFSFRVVPDRSPRGRRRVVTAMLTVVALLSAGLVLAPVATAATIVVHPVVAKNVVTLLNQERAAHHLPALRMNTDLINSAYAHNMGMAGRDTLSHQLPGEKDLGARFDAAHYHWSAAGECIGWTTDNTNTGALNMERAMYNEKAPDNGHRLIILSSAYRDVGISVITDVTHQRLWITADYGHLM